MAQARDAIGLAESVNYQANGWDYSVGELRRFFERARTHMYLLSKIPAVHEPYSALLAHETPRGVEDMLGIYLWEAQTLGARTAELHLSLAQPTDKAAFQIEMQTRADIQELAERTMRSFESAEWRQSWRTG